MTIDLAAIAAKTPGRDLPPPARSPITPQPEQPLDPEEAERERSAALEELLGLKPGVISVAPEKPAADSAQLETSSPELGEIDIEAIAVRSPKTVNDRGKRSKPKPRHEDLYRISKEELKARLAARRRSRQCPRRDLGQITNHHRVAMAMTPGRWYVTPFLSDATGLPLSRITQLVLRMYRWPYELLERAPIGDHFPQAVAEPFLVPSPLTRGGRTLRTPAKFVWRLTPKGCDLKREGEEFRRRDVLG